MRASSIVVLLSSVIVAHTVTAQELNPVRREPSAAAGDESEPRMIVKFRSSSDTARLQAQSPPEAARDAMAALSSRAGFSVAEARPLAAGLHVLQVAPEAADVYELLERIRADGAVEYAEVDRRRYLHALPDDPLYFGQWYLQHRDDAPSAIDAEGAWQLTRGSAGVVIGIIDSGILFDHPDLNGRVLPGYDFVSNPVFANDGDGWDADASDPGDWLTVAEARSRAFAGCTPSDSSWHGTRVAGIISAQTNNSKGIAGTTWKSWILPVRAFGKCGGYDSDILAAMLWSAGFQVDGVPDNPYPAHLLNLSFGAGGGCPASYRDVIARITERGTLVIVSAGNEGGPTAAPANCADVAAVAGLRQAGTKVGYSSLGPEVAIAAPAGNCVNLGGACLYSIDTTFNLGATTPDGHGYTDQLTYNVGTSFSAPIVAGIAGLMLSVNGNLRPRQLIQRLQEGAVPFPVASDPSVPQCRVPAHAIDVQGFECTCATETCGAGMANAVGALHAALRPLAAVTVLGPVAAGQNVELSAAGSAAACGHTITDYAWSILDDEIHGLGIAGMPDPAMAAVVAPTSGFYTVRLTVIDDAGREDHADVILSPEAATTTAPKQAGPNACLPDIEAPASVVSVSVTPSTAIVQAGVGSTAFTATVENTSNAAVVWQVDGVTGGDATVGTISEAGVYSAPATVPTSATVTITAVWSGDASRLGSAQVTITPPASSSGSGGGGGRMDLLTSILMLAGLLARRLRRRARVASRCNHPVARRA